MNYISTPSTYGKNVSKKTQSLNTLGKGPLPMTYEMWQAVLDDRKTQTRRVMNWTPTNDDLIDICNPDAIYGLLTGEEIKARYQPGDILYIPEPIEITCDEENGLAEGVYLWENWKQANTFRDVLLTGKDLKKLQARKRRIYAPTTARFMLKTFARTFVQITDIKAERLQDISIMDVMAEGCPFPEANYGDRAIKWFQNLWDSINAKFDHGWETNPMVWVYTFKRIEEVQS